MKKKILMLCMGCFLVSLTAKAQWVVSDPGNLAQGIINAAKNIVHTSSTATNMANNFQETVKIYKHDKERMDIIDRCYNDMLQNRSLVQYYTNKNIGVSYLRAKKRNDLDRVMALYGSPNERYW